MIEPVIIGPCTLYLGDCIDVLPTLKGVDVVVTDPPYGIGYSHGAGGGKLARSTRFDHHPIAGDERPFDPLSWLSFQKVILWGANHYASKLPDSPSWFIWDKRDGICSNDQADCEMAWSNLGGPARLKRHLWNGMLKDSERGEIRVHPTQKPIEVMTWCIEKAKVPSGETVFDPYMGSGTTGIACIRTGRRFVGVEICKEYFDIAVERIKRELQQQTLSL
jgi:site-specific DNA-methyltransferase (adenine-specific)/modification methylase